MLKFILILSISYTIFFADSSFHGRCVQKFDTSSNSIFINFSDGGTTTIPYDDFTFNQLVDNLDLFVFNIDSNKCELFSQNNSLKLPYRDYNFLLALFGLLLGNSIMSVFIRS